MSSNRAKYGASFLATLFLSYLLGLSFFLHMHYVEGVAIMHSHPFAAGEGHSHTKAELFLIDRLTHFDSGVDFETFHFEPLVHEFYIVEYSEFLSLPKGSYHSLHLLRAPPLIY